MIAIFQRRALSEQRAHGLGGTEPWRGVCGAAHWPFCHCALLVGEKAPKERPQGREGVGSLPPLGGKDGQVHCGLGGDHRKLPGVGTLPAHSSGLLARGAQELEAVGRWPNECKV